MPTSLRERNHDIGKRSVRSELEENSIKQYKSCSTDYLKLLSLALDNSPWNDAQDCNGQLWRLPDLERWGKSMPWFRVLHWHHSCFKPRLTLGKARLSDFLFWGQRHQIDCYQFYIFLSHTHTHTINRTSFLSFFKCIILMRPISVWSYGWVWETATSCNFFFNQPTEVILNKTTLAVIKVKM